MRYLMALLLLTGCAAQRPASTSYGVSADGTVSAETRSALSGSTAPGRQELIGVYLPFPPFAIKGGLEWDGMPVVIGPTPSAQAAPCGVQTTFVEETYTEMVPVQKTRQVPVRSVSLPVPRQSTPCPEPIGAICPEPAIEYPALAKAK